MNFFVYIWVITTTIKIQNISIIPKGYPQITSVVISLLPPPNPGNHWHDFCSDNPETNPDASSWLSYSRKAFCIQIFFLSIMLLRSICVIIACISSSFLFVAEYFIVHIDAQFIHSAVDDVWLVSVFFAILNKTATHIHILLFV